MIVHRSGDGNDASDGSPQAQVAPHHLHFDAIAVQRPTFHAAGDEDVARKSFGGTAEHLDETEAATCARVVPVDAYSTATCRSPAAARASRRFGTRAAGSMLNLADPLIACLADTPQLAVCHSGFEQAANGFAVVVIQLEKPSQLVDCQRARGALLENREERVDGIAFERVAMRHALHPDACRCRVSIDRWG
ncbi:MAG: hypothetical protein HY270_04230 [Deltaproteobacteria bacterium]|nr:hypothetical protein [Deltaproteobacteria bacterium]